MPEITASQAAAQEAVVTAFKETAFRKDPVLSWIRGVHSIDVNEHFAYINVIVWLHETPDMRVDVAVFLKKGGGGNWEPKSAICRFSPLELQAWIFDHGKVYRQ